jgi:hypothetical protein
MLPPGFREIPASAWFDFSRVALFPATRLTRKQHSFPFFAFPNLFPGYYPIPEFLPTLMPPAAGRAFIAGGHPFSIAGVSWPGYAFAGKYYPHQILFSLNNFCKNYETQLTPF